MSLPQSQLKNDNEELLIPFVEWLQRIKFGDNPSNRYLKRFKMNLTSTKRVYFVLNNKGKVKASQHLIYWAKVQRVWEGCVGIEIVNAIDKKRVLFQTRAAQFDFNNVDIYSEKFQAHVENYMVLPYNYDIIISSGAGYKADPFNENSTVIDTYSYDGELVTPSVLSSTFSSIPSTSTESSKTKTTNDLDLKKDVILLQRIDSLKNTNAMLTARFLISQFTSDELAQQLNEQKSNRESFDPNEFEPKRLVTTTLSGHLYGVNHKLNTQSTFSLKEVIEIKEGESRLKTTGLSNELDILKQLKSLESKCKNLLYLKEHHVERTPFRTSHYLLMEQTVINLQDACNLWIKQKDQKVTSIITAQVLSGLSFLKDNFQTIHGNLSFKTILFDFQGIIKLSGFEFAHSINSPIDANLLLSGNYEEDSLFKHPKILEYASKGEKIIVKSNIDIWSLGCINYKLMTGMDLFIDAQSWKCYFDIVEEKKQLIDELALSFLADYKENAEPSTYLLSNNIQQLVDYNILNYCNTD